jgi:serine phosphatase RsbU (regulator of sigma subunit)
MIKDPLRWKRLRYNVLLETLTDEEFGELEQKLIEHVYLPDQVIIEDEGYGDEVFFLVEGRIRITKRSTTGESRLLALLHPGDCFGELELIAGRPRSARVIAMDACVTYTLRKADFDTLLYQSRAVAVRLLQVLSIRLRATNNTLVAETQRLRDQNRTEIHALEQLIEATKSLNSTLDLNKLLDILVDITLGLVDAERGTVYVLDAQRQELWTRVAKGLDTSGRVTIRLPLGKGIAGYVAATGDLINIPDAYLDPRFNPEFDRQTGYRTRSILCMPIRTKDGAVTGVFQLLNKREGAFTDDDTRILDALSVHAAIALENARLYEQERLKIRIERDLLAAREVQMSLLPRHTPSVPEYAFAAVAVSAREVAGDLYDFIRLDGQRIAVTIGDVSGKGLPAALMMAHIQGSVRDVAHEIESPGECLTMLNQRITATTSDEKFVTLVYGILDTRMHTFRYANAGHNPPILIASDGTIRTLESGGTLLGIVEGLTYDEDTVSLAPGDVMVLYTDGLSESMNARQELLGDERIASRIASVHDTTAVEIKDALLAAVAEHQGNEPPADDLTLIVVKRLRTT